MTHAKLSNAARDHVHQDMPVRNDFGRGLNEMCFHNLGNAMIRLTELNSEPEWDPIAFRKIEAEQPSIVRYRRNTIGEFLCYVPATPWVRCDL